MITFKLIILGVVVVITILTLIKNLNRWAIQMSLNDAKGLKESFGNRFGFVKSTEQKWYLLFCKVWIIFVSIMLNIAIYVALFFK